MRRILTVLAVIALAPAGVAHADTATTLVSATVDGGPSVGISGKPSISADGRYVAFSSSADNLVSGDDNHDFDVFVRDRRTGAITRVSVDSAGVPGNGPSGSPSISGDGRYVVFASDATNLVAGDTNKAGDIFLHDMQTGVTKRITVNLFGEQADSDSFHPVISADGQHVAYDSYASNLAWQDTNGVHDVFEYDVADGGTSRVSVDSNGQQGNGISQLPSISADGRYVAFSSSASNIALFADTNHADDVFVHDRLSGRTDRISTDVNGEQGNNDSRYGAISADGRFVVFNSYASNLVAGDTNNRSDMFVWDRFRFTMTRIDVDPDGRQLDTGTSSDVWPSISADGRYIAYESGADGLVPGDVNHVWDVFVRDRVAGSTSLVSVAGDGTEGDDYSHQPALSADGRQVAFMSYASNFVPGTSRYSSNVYVRDLAG
jgi:Tol biopolymer transport system component